MKRESDLGDPSLQSGEDVAARLGADVSSGLTGAEVLNFGDGPRSFAMGGAQSALTADSYSLNINPGGLANVEYQEASFVYNSWVSGVTNQTLLYARPHIRYGTFAAGLTRFSMLVTATVLDPHGDPANLAQAAEVIDQLGPACQLRLRRCYFGQAAAFTAALGVGVVLPAHVAVPQVVRDHL